MRLSFKVEIQPTQTQLRALLQAAGNARWAWNWGLAKKNEAWQDRKNAIECASDVVPKIPTAIDLHRELNRLKKLPVGEGGVPWMYQASKCAPQEALRDLDKAFQHFFRRVKAGEKPGYPKFKSKSQGIGGFRLHGSISVDNRAVRLPKIGRVRLKPGERGYIPAGKYSSASVTESCGRWFVSIAGPELADTPSRGGPEVGIDLGIATFATLSGGDQYRLPQSLKKAKEKVTRLQRELSRKQKGSSNRTKARANLARAFRRASNIKKDFFHKLSTDLTKSHGLVVIEDLKISEMTRKQRGEGRKAKSRLNRAMRDSSLYEFRRQLEYKGKRFGCRVVVVSPSYTSQMCSRCFHVNRENRPTQSVFKCQHCAHEENADVNAARNILIAGSCPEIENACGDGVSRGFLEESSQPSAKQESAVETCSLLF